MRTQPAEAHPLYWPEGWARTPAHERRESRYRIRGWRSVKALAQILEMFGASHVVISTNLDTRRDGLPRVGQRRPEDPGVAVYFTRGGEQRVIACDQFVEVGCNARAVLKTVEALRAIERAGATQILARTFDGFRALPASDAAPVERPWWEVLGLGAATLDVMDDGDACDFVKVKYRRLSKKAHPDAGGSDAAMAELNRARDEALTHYRGKA